MHDQWLTDKFEVLSVERVMHTMSDCGTERQPRGVVRQTVAMELCCADVGVARPCTRFAP